MRSHPMLRKNWKEKCIPLLFHSDGAAFQNNDSLVTCSFRGLLSSQAGMQDHLWIFSFPKSVTTEGTLHTLWSWIVWSLEALFHNRWPSKDPEGKSLQAHPALEALAGKPILKDGFFAILYGYMGDMEEFQNNLGMRHKAADMPCYLCGCNRSDKPWNDFGNKPAWRSSRSDCQQDLKHPMFKAPGVRIQSLCLDTLRMLDLGMTAHAIGNVFYAFLQKGRRERQFRTLLNFIQSHQRESDHGKPLSTFAMTNLTNPKALSTTYPCLQHLKAAQVRCLVPVARLLLEEFFGDSEQDRHMKAVMKFIDQFYDFLYTAPIIPSSSEGMRAFTSLNRALQSYQWLAAQAVSEGKCLWSMVPKHHYSAELAGQARFLNPRFVWCYGSEDYVGTIADLGSTCLRGSPTFHMLFGMAEKLEVAMTLDLALRV